MSLKQKAYKCTILCIDVRGCQLDDTGPKLSPKLPQFCKDDVQTCRNTLEASHYTFLPLAPKIRKTEAPLKHEIVALTPTRLCNVALVRRYGQLIMPCREQFEASKACCPFLPGQIGI